MTSVLILYMTRGGHTARIARRLCEHIGASGGRAEMMPLVEAEHEGVDWNRYDVVALTNAAGAVQEICVEERC